MSNARDKMRSALQAVVIPHLRERGFTGSCPHFRRAKQGCIDLLTFQFDRHGGGFIIEIAQSGSEGSVTPWGKQISPGKITAWDLPPKQRVRIQPQPGAGTDSWFRYESAATDEAFRRIAESIFPFLEQTERMFEEFERVRKETAQ